MLDGYKFTAFGGISHYGVGLKPGDSERMVFFDGQGEAVVAQNGLGKFAPGFVQQGLEALITGGVVAE